MNIGCGQRYTRLETDQGISVGCFLLRASQYGVSPGEYLSCHSAASVPDIQSDLAAKGSSTFSSFWSATIPIAACGAVAEPIFDNGSDSTCSPAPRAHTLCFVISHRYAVLREDTHSQHIVL